MKLKNVIVWILLLGIVVLLMSTSVQAKELTEVNATDILEKIENGESFPLVNYIITGKLDLSKINLTTVPIAREEWQITYFGLEEELKIVKGVIIIKNCIFVDDVDFSYTQFRTIIDFSKTSFLGEINFRGADFAGGANFESANFTGVADFGDANFTGDANFVGADFAGGANFMNANFAGDAEFIFADFAGGADFTCADFAGGANFMYADFAGDAHFMYANFSGHSTFYDVDFSDDAKFESANFTDYASFDSTEFNKVSFTGTSFTNVSLNESDFNQMKVKWSTLKDVLVFDGLTYIKLIKNFREMEQFEDADAAYYQYRQLSQANKKWSSKLIDVVAGASCGYGVKPERTLIWAFVLIMVFTLVYWRGKGIKRLKENDGDKNRVSRWAAFYNSFYFSVVTFTTVGYGDWYPEDRYRIVVMIEGVLGWLLLALFIVTLANVMIRP